MFLAKLALKQKLRYAPGLVVIKIKLKILITLPKSYSCSKDLFAIWCRFASLGKELQHVLTI